MLTMVHNTNILSHTRRILVKQKEEEMKKGMKMLLVAVLVLPMMMLLSACGTTAEQLYLERVPMLTVPEGRYELVSYMSDWEKATVTDGTVVHGGNTTTYYWLEVSGNALRTVVESDNIHGKNVVIKNYHYVADAFGVLKLHYTQQNPLNDENLLLTNTGTSNEVPTGWVLGPTMEYANGKITITTINMPKIATNKTEVTVQVYQKI